MVSFLSLAVSARNRAREPGASDFGVFAVWRVSEERTPSAATLLLCCACRWASASALRHMHVTDTTAQSLSVRAPGRTFTLRRRDAHETHACIDTRGGSDLVLVEEHIGNAGGYGKLSPCLSAYLWGAGMR